MDKLVSLLKSGRTLYHTQDLALLWGITNRHSLRVTIYRYIKKGLLYSVIKGLYSTIPVSQLNRHELGSILIHRYAYLSCESVLEEYGVINQKIFPLTYVSSVSRKLEINGSLYIYRQMRPQFLLNTQGVNLASGIYKASLERAVSDCQYLGLNIFYDSPDLINFEKVDAIKRKIGY